MEKSCPLNLSGHFRAPFSGQDKGVTSAQCFHGQWVGRLESWGGLPFLYQILAHAETSQLKVDSSLNPTYSISVYNFGYHTPHKIRRGAVAYEVDFI